MSAEWAINGVTLDQLGLEFTGGTFNTGHRSIMTLRKVGDFTAAESYAWGDPVTLTRNGAKYFQGRVNSLPHNASEDDESQDIHIVDAWQDLEDTIYMEEWPAGASGTVALPIAILGRKANGAACTDAEQISEAVNYAAGQGVDIQMGTIPTGLPLWQSEVRNASVAEVIRISLRYHPDWVPWIDHSTTPPTLNFTARAALSTRTIEIDEGDTSNVSITRRDDLKPDAVRILYLNAVVVDGTTYRDWIEDHAPDGGPTEGPRVISNIIELAGGQMQFQKQRIKTRALPTDHSSCRAWLKKKFPKLADIPDAAWAVRMTSKELLPEPDEGDDPEADPINARAERLIPTDLADVPRELVKGSLEDWMRKKAGQVRIGFTIRINPIAGAPTRKKLAPFVAMTGKTVNATNAETKIYKGVTQWVEPESAPSGIAASIYNSLSAYQYEGSITTVMEDVSGTRYHGCRLNIGGGRSEWASMNAMVHSVSFDIATGTTTISVGPAPFLAAQDMLDLARQLRGRKVTWMSEDERTSNEMGATDDPGSKGDTVGGYEQAKEDTEYEAPITGRFTPYIGGDNSDKLFFTPGTVTYCRMASEDRQDDDATPEANQTQPIFPSIEETPINAEEPPSFSIGGKSNASFWLCTQRMICSTSLVTVKEIDRIEMVERGKKPKRKEGELHRLLCEMDFESVPGGGKSITNLDVRIQSDAEVWYVCDEDGSSLMSDSDADPDDSDVASSELSDVPDDSQDSGSDPNCPWEIVDIDWVNKRPCHRSTGKAGIAIEVRLKLGSFMSKCQKWYATFVLEGGVPSTQHLKKGQEGVGSGGIKVALTSRFSVNQLAFIFEPARCKVDQYLEVTLEAEQKDGAEHEEPCCQGAGSKRKLAFKWPGYCNFNGNCKGTSLVAP